MTDRSCVNCGQSATGTYELLLRSTSHTEVALCDPCHEAIEREVAESDTE